MLARLHSNCISHLNPGYIILCNGHAEIVEKAADGAGTLRVSLPDEALLLKGKAGTHQVIWLSASRCADAALLTVDATTTTIHIFELKSTVRSGDLEVIREQIEGMLHNARALIGFMGLPVDIRVRLYLVWKRELLSSDANPNPVTLKRLVGEQLTKRERILTELLVDNQMSVLDLGPIPLTIIQRDAAGNAAHTL